MNNLINELGNEQQAIASLKVKKGEQETVSHPFMDAYKETANLKLTDNGALTYGSTTDACLDLYYGIEAVANQGRDALLEASWEQDPLLTLHIIFYARSIHRGKSLKEAFFYAYCWLIQNYPQTAIKNLHVLIDGTIRTDAELQASRKNEKKNLQVKNEGWEMLSEDEMTKPARELLSRVDFKTHGVWKDLCTLLTIYCQGELNGPTGYKYKALEWPRTERGTKQERRDTRREQIIRYNLRFGMSEEDAKKNIEKCHEDHMKHNQEKMEEARKERLRIRAERNQVVNDLLENDKTYRALHFTVAFLFANQLKIDMAQLEKNRMLIKEGKMKNGRHAEGFNLSLAAKWAPSLGLSHDKHTFLATSISEILFPPDLYQEKDESRTHYLNKVREMYRKEYCVPLRAAMDITEHYMAEGKWDSVDFRHMSSVCTQQNLGLFFKHAPDTVISYMDQVAEGKKKVSGATLTPNELVHRVRTGDVPKKLADVINRVDGLLEKYIDTQKNLVNGQWNTLLESIRDTSLLAGGSDNGDKKKKKIDLGECIAICDVSGSMMSGADKPELQPLNAAIGLSLAVSNLAKPPFNGAIITFTHQPKVFMVDTSLTFTEQVEEILDSEVGYNTDICKVFTDVLLPMAKKHNLAPQDMVKRLFIFTDMEFDAVDNGMDDYLTTHEFIRKQYREAGYEIPELVWWNLCSGRAYQSGKKMNTPVTKDDTGVSLLSGFSSSMLRTFLDGGAAEDEDDEVSEKMDVDGNTVKVSSAKFETPVDFMRKAVMHESFDGLVVFD